MQTLSREAMPAAIAAAHNTIVMSEALGVIALDFAERANRGERIPLDEIEATIKICADASYMKARIEALAITIPPSPEPTAG